MPPIGDTLRRERLRRNLELPQIAQELKISSRFLHAIEEERFDQLPATVFAKNFVRQYALLLELDGEELALQAQRILEARTAPPEFPPASKPDIPEIPLDNVKPRDGSGADRSSGSSWMTAAALFVAAMLVCSAAYWWWERPHQQPVAHVAPAPAPAAAPAAESNPNAAVRVEITAIDAVWVRARVNGKDRFSALLQPRQTRNVDTDGAVELLVGNAGGATIALNGKPLSLEGFPAGTIGPKGQVRMVQLTSGGFQMVPSKPPDPRDR